MGEGAKRSVIRPDGKGKAASSGEEAGEAKGLCLGLGDDGEHRQLWGELGTDPGGEGSARGRVLPSGWDVAVPLSPARLHPNTVPIVGLLVLGAEGGRHLPQATSPPCPKHISS